MRNIPSSFSDVGLVDEVVVQGRHQAARLVEVRTPAATFVAAVSGSSCDDLVGRHVWLCASSGTALVSRNGRLVALRVPKYLPRRIADAGIVSIALGHLMRLASAWASAMGLDSMQTEFEGAAHRRLMSRNLVRLKDPAP